MTRDLQMNKPRIYPVGTMLICVRKVPGDVSGEHDRLLILRYKGLFRKVDPFDAACVYVCWDPTKNVKVELHDWYKRAKCWKAILPE